MVYRPPPNYKAGHYGEILEKSFKTIVIENFNKVILNPESLPKKQYARPPRSCNIATVGAGSELEVPDARLDTTRNTFFFSAPTLWNNLVSPEQANAPSVEAFKRHFSIRPSNNDQHGN